MNSIKQAEYLARFVHEGQKRRGGDDAIVHPQRMAQAGIEKGEGNNDICARWTHDTIEDAKNPKVISDLIHAWFYEPDAEDENYVFNMVTLLTRSKYVPYNIYILGIVEASEYPNAIVIKFDDMTDNTREEHIEERLYRKYREACLIIESNGVKIPEILVKRLLSD